MSLLETRSEPLLRVAGLRKTYGRTAVLKGVDLDVHTGEVVVVIGPSGGGKSTMLRAINCLEWPDGGSVHLDGELIGFSSSGSGTVRRLRESAIARQRQQIGMVFQQFNLFSHMTALGNIMEALVGVRKQPKREAEDRARGLLAKMGLADKADSYPRQLSGGQQQRVAIARALAMAPKLMLFDEPTSALDPEMVGEIQDVLKELADDGTTMVIVTHEIGFARQLADRVVFIDDGVVVEDGPPTQVLDGANSSRVQAFVARHQ